MSLNFFQSDSSKSLNMVIKELTHAIRNFSAGNHSPLHRYSIASQITLVSVNWRKRCTRPPMRS